MKSTTIISFTCLLTCFIIIPTHSANPNSPRQIETILLVDDDGGPNNGGTYPDFQQFYFNPLNQAGYSYDIFIVDWSITNPPQNGPTAAEMSDYDCIIWFTGDTWGYYGLDVLTQTDEQNLAEYLDGCGTLFLNAMDYLYASYPSSGTFNPGQFPYDYLGVVSTEQDYWDPPIAVQGAPGGFAEGLIFNVYRPWPGGTFWSDKLIPRNQKLLNVDGSQEACAVQYGGGVFYTAFSTVGLEGLCHGPDSVAHFVDCILTGFGSLNAVNDKNLFLIDRYILHQNFPNPFNPTTQITYQIPVTSFVTISIYNTLGQHITTLVNQQQHLGTYNITWNAQNLPSGIYFYQLQTTDFHYTRPMILLK